MIRAAGLKTGQIAADAITSRNQLRPVAKSKLESPIHDPTTLDPQFFAKSHPFVTQKKRRTPPRLFENSPGPRDIKHDSALILIRLD